MAQIAYRRSSERLNVEVWTAVGAARTRIVPIPGTTKLDRLEENMGAVSIEITAAICATSLKPLPKSRYKDRDTLKPRGDDRPLRKGDCDDHYPR